MSCSRPLNLSVHSHVSIKIISPKYKGHINVVFCHSCENSLQTYAAARPAGGQNQLQCAHARDTQAERVWQLYDRYTDYTKAMASTSNRRVCLWCKEELARTAYYHYLNDGQGVICPVRRQSAEQQSKYNGDSESSTNSESSFEAMVESNEDSDSSFDLSESKLSCDENELREDSSSPLSEMNDSEDADAISVDKMLQISSSSESECSLSQEEEIWDISADDSGTEDFTQINRPMRLLLEYVYS